MEEYSDNTVTSLYGFKQDVKENNDMWIYFFYTVYLKFAHDML